MPAPAASGVGAVELTSVSPLGAIMATGRVPLTARETELMYGGTGAGANDTMVRQVEEQRWMCPRADQVQTSEENSGLHRGFEHPDRTLVVGTNGSHCYALVCVRELGSKPDPVLRITQEANAENEALAYYQLFAGQNNPVAGYKLALMERERHAYRINHTFRMRTTDDRERLASNLMKHGRADVILREPVRYLTDPKRKYKPLAPGIRHAKRKTEGANVVHRGAADEQIVALPPPEDPHERTCTFTLATLAVAQLKRGWKDVSGIKFHVAAGTVPVAALNDTTLAILSTPTAAHPVLCLEYFDIGPKTFRPKPRSKRYLTMPAEMLRASGGKGTVTMHVNDNGTVSIAYGNGAMVVSEGGDATAGGVVVFTTTDTRTVTAAPVFGASTMAMCTDQGECLLFSITAPITAPSRGGDGRNEEEEEEDGSVADSTPVSTSVSIPFHGIMLPASEPIFDAHWVAASGWLYLHTVNEVACVVVATGELLITTFVRPTCMASCGAVLFVANKSGIMAAKRPLLTEERARYFDPPKRKDRNDARLPLLQQIVYRGVHASRTQVVVVDESGVVRVLKI